MLQRKEILAVAVFLSRFSLPRQRETLLWHGGNLTYAYTTADLSGATNERLAIARRALPRAGSRGTNSVVSAHLGRAPSPRKNNPAGYALHRHRARPAGSLQVPCISDRSRCIICNHRSGCRTRYNVVPACKKHTLNPPMSTQSKRQ